MDGEWHNPSKEVLVSQWHLGRTMALIHIVAILVLDGCGNWVPPVECVEVAMF